MMFSKLYKRNMYPADFLYNMPHPVETQEETVDDNDKSFTVPTDKAWKLMHVMIKYEADVVVGNRIFEFQILNGDGDLIYMQTALNAIVAGATEYIMIIPGFDEPKETLATYHYLCFPMGIILPEAFQIRVWDSANVDANDDMSVYLMYNEISYGILAEPS